MKSSSWQSSAYLLTALAFGGEAYADFLPSAELVGSSGGNVPVPINSLTSSGGNHYPTGLTYALSAPGTYNYGDSFTSNVPDLTGFNPALPSGVTYSFYDDYFISVPDATVDSLTSTINLGGVLGLTNLDARIYSLSSNPGGLVLSVPNGGATPGWGNSVVLNQGVSASTTIVGPTVLSSGNYVLEIRAQTDSAGGSYSGLVNLTPIPLPAALPLLLGGLGLFAASARRRRTC